jgi:hypothetical protein
MDDFYKEFQKLNAGNSFSNIRHNFYTVFKNKTLRKKDSSYIWGLILLGLWETAEIIKEQRRRVL